MLITSYLSAERYVKNLAEYFLPLQMSSTLAEAIPVISAAAQTEFAKLATAAEATVFPAVRDAAATVTEQVKAVSWWTQFFLIVQIIAMIAIIVFVIYYIVHQVRVDRFASGVVAAVAPAIAVSST